MNLKYFIKKSKSATSNIYVRFWDSNRIDQTAGTKLNVQFEHWNKDKQEVKNIATVANRDFTNSKLRNLKTFILDQYNIDFNSQQNINDTWLKTQINIFFGRVNTDESHKIYFVAWIGKFIDDCPNKATPPSESTITKFNRTKNKLTDYQTHFDTKLRFQDIDLKFYESFLFYCQKIEMLNNNTVGGFITIIKNWCAKIEIEGLPISPQYKHSDFKAISNKTKDVYLTEAEIDTVFNYNFELQERLDRTRDNFIIGLRTGLRISDFMKLKQLNIVGDYIEIETSKTEHPVVIPMHSQVKAILQKRKGELPPAISDQKFNEYVKEVCKTIGFADMVDGAKMINKKDEKDFFGDSKVKIKSMMRKEFGTFPKHELITSHTCRRSFASNLYGKLDNPTIMAITGHKTETMFLKYIKITPREHAEKLKEHWKKVEAEKQAKKETKNIKQKL
jgi:integrase